MINKHNIIHRLRKVLQFCTLFLQSVLYFILIFTVITFVTSKSPILGNFRTMVVLSGSMEPVLTVGSLIFIRKQIGYNNRDIITYTVNGVTNVTHRIAGIDFTEGGIVYITKGDANRTSDSSQVLYKNVLGKVIFTIPYLGSLINLLNSAKGFISFIIAPSIIFIIIELWNIKNEIEKEIEKKILAKIQKQQTL